MKTLKSNEILGIKISPLLIIIFSVCISCTTDDTVTNMNENNNNTIAPGNDPNFTIVANSDAGFSNYNRKVVVFGIDIYAVAAVEDAKLLHAANVMAQYLDNDEDGTVDNQLVLDKMVENKAYVGYAKRFKWF